jgi:hypothetical protein
MKTTRTPLKEVEARLWRNGYHKREWGCEISLGSVVLGYGVAIFLVKGLHQLTIYKIIK